MKHEITNKTEYCFTDNEDVWVYTIHFIDGEYDYLQMPSEEHWLNNMCEYGVDEAEKIIKQIRKLQKVEQTAKNKLSKG